MALTRLGNEITARLLSPREQARVGYVLAQTAKNIHDLLDQGEVLRTDGFFDADNGNRSDAEEIAESLLLKCQREAEEKKLPYMAHLLANLAFTPKISAAVAHQITKIAEQLTYRQLCILKLAATKDEFKLRTTDYSDQQTFSYELSQVLFECIDLSNRYWIGFGNSTTLAIPMINPSEIVLQGFGGVAYSMMRLEVIPKQDVKLVAAHLQ